MIRPAAAAATLFLLSAAVLHAQDIDSTHVDLTGDLGFVNAAGNTNLTTLNVAEKLAYTRGAVTGTQSVAFVYGRTDGTTSASQWRGLLRGDVALSPRIAVFATAGVERNRFAGIARRLEQGAGLSFAAIRTAHDTLRLEGGFTATEERAVDETSNRFIGARAAGYYRRGLGPKAFLAQSVELLPDLAVGRNLRLNTETALVAPLSSRLAIKLAYAIRFDNLPEPGFRKTDRLFTSGLQVTL